MAALQTFGPGTLGGLGTFGPDTFAGGTPLRRWLVPGWCGCCTCTYFLDRFTRPDNKDLGSNWDEQVELWAIDKYRLVTRWSDSRCICLAVDTPNNDEHVVSAALRGMGVGDQPRLISSKLTGADTYWFFEMTYGATTVDLDLYQRTAGSDVQRGSTTTLYNMAPGIPLALRIAFDGTEICAQYRRITDTIWTTATSYATTAITDPICGVGTGTVNGEVRVDDFRLEKHGTLYPGCPECVARCFNCTGPMPDEFLLEPIIPDPPPGDYLAYYKVLLPQDGAYVVRRVAANSCLYMIDIDPPIRFWPFLQFVSRLYLWFTRESPSSAVQGHIQFPHLPEWAAVGQVLIWHNVALSTSECAALTDEQGWRADYHRVSAYDWNVTAL